MSVTKLSSQFVGYFGFIPFLANVVSHCECLLRIRGWAADTRNHISRQVQLRCQNALAATIAKCKDDAGRSGNTGKSHSFWHQKDYKYPIHFQNTSNTDLNFYYKFLSHLNLMLSTQTQQNPCFLLSTTWTLIAATH